MNLHELYGKPLPKLEFSKQWLRAMPRQSGIYALANYFGVVLYIGSSNNLQRRMAEHLNEGVKLEPSPAGKVFWIAYHLCGQGVLRAQERGCMQQFELCDGSLPFFNKIEAPV